MNNHTGEQLTGIWLARQSILNELKRRYRAGDNNVKPLDLSNAHRWHNPEQQDNCFTGSGIMPCPCCKVGTLRYSRAAYNGHIHGNCTTTGCVAWME